MRYDITIDENGNKIYTAKNQLYRPQYETTLPLFKQGVKDDHDMNFKLTLRF